MKPIDKEKIFQRKIDERLFDVSWETKMINSVLNSGRIKDGGIVDDNRFIFFTRTAAALAIFSAAALLCGYLYNYRASASSIATSSYAYSNISEIAYDEIDFAINNK